MKAAPRPAWRAWARVLRIGAILCAMATVSGAGEAVAPAPQVITSHGYAVFGPLKYGPDFGHLEYTNPAAPKGGFYRYSGGRTFDSLNQFSLTGTFPYVIEYMFDPLMERSQDEPASFYGVIAKTISYPKDLSWVEFELRPEARWHDGKPITVEDVLFTIDALKGDLIRPQTNAGARAVAKAYRTGPNRVRMELVQKNNPTLPAVVGAMKVLPRHYFEHRDLGQPSLEPPVTSGPYRIGKVNPGRTLDLIRDKDYWAQDLPLRKGRFNFDRVQHVFFYDPQMVQEAFYTGRIHMRNEFTARRWKAEDKLPAFASGDILRDNTIYRHSSFYGSIVMNTRRPFLSDRRVRQAIQLAFDFEFVRDIILHGAHGRTESYFTNTEYEASGLPSSGELKLLEPYRESLPPDVFTTRLDAPKAGTRPSQRDNLKRARDLLAEAGYRIRDMALIDPATGEPVVLELIANSPLLINQVGLFRQNMKRLGIDVRYRNFDTAQFRQLSGAYRFDLLLGTAVFGPRDPPGRELLTSWSSQSADQPNQLNLAGVREPAIDNALKAVIEATDRQTVIDAMRAIDRIARANFYSIPLHHVYPAPVGEKPIAYWDRFGRPEKDLTYVYPLMTLDHWWWDPAKEARLSHGVFE